MWYMLRISRSAGRAQIAGLHDLLQAAFRNLILVTGAAYIMWAFLTTEDLPVSLIVRTMPVTVAMLLTCALSLVLLSRSLLLAQVTWQVGLIVVITMLVQITQQPMVAFLYALLPFMAAVTVGWPAGLLVEVIVALLSGLLMQGRVLAYPLSDGLGLAIIAAGAFTTLLGWTASAPFMTAFQWYLYSFAQAEEQMEDARQHRGEVVRVLKELDQAYHRLERTNAMLVLARAEAEEAKEARNRFVLAVSHELRTPLNFILGFSELMVNSPSTYAALQAWPPGLYDDVQEIYRSSTHLMRLVNDVLDLGQIEALRMVLVKDWVSPLQTAQEVEEMVRSAFNRKGLWLRSVVEPDLPDIFVDCTRIRQILLNLVSNSLRLTQHGGITVRIRREDEHLLYCVEDTGPGIEKDEIPKLFQPFMQVGDSSWRRREGAGLGLAISRRFVELHGGRMWVESEAGQGTSVYFTLPLSGAGRESEDSAPLEAPDAGYWRQLKRKAQGQRTLLVLSPDPAAGEVISRHVDGYGVVAVETTSEVCPAIMDLLPSALVLDRALVHEEELRGLAQSLPYDLPVVSFTFPGSPRSPRRLPAGVSGYLVKPVERQALTEAIRGLGPGVHRLLVVDDDPGMIRFVTLALQSVAGSPEADGGYELMSAATGGEALRQLREGRPDAVLLDLALPDITGWDVLAELRRDASLGKVQVLLITAHDWPQAPAEGDGEALRLMLRRPLSRHELTTVLQSLLYVVQSEHPVLEAEPAGPPGHAG